MMRLGATTVAFVGTLFCTVAPAWGWEDYESGQDAPIIAVPAAPEKSSDRLPIFGIGGDVGVPDGALATLVVRPFSWIRAQGGLGTNGISRGWRAGLTLLPLRAGPSLTFEYGRYADGNANTLARKFVGSDFEGSPLLEQVGYEYGNLHLGLDFGSRRVVFYVHGGFSMVRGEIRNVAAAISQSAASAGASSQTTEVAVRSNPRVKAVGSSVKLGLVIYVW